MSLLSDARCHTENFPHSYVTTWTYLWWTHKPTDESNPTWNLTNIIIIIITCPFIHPFPWWWSLRADALLPLHCSCFWWWWYNNERVDDADDDDNRLWLRLDDGNATKKIDIRQSHKIWEQLGMLKTWRGIQRQTWLLNRLQCHDYREIIRSRRADKYFLTLFDSQMHLVKAETIRLPSHSIPKHWRLILIIIYFIRTDLRRTSN